MPRKPWQCESRLSGFSTDGVYCSNDVNHVSGVSRYNYIARQLEKYADNIENGLISFGQYRGRTVSSVLSEPEGKEYLKWCLKSTWLSPMKHKDFIAECEKLGIS